jgi:phosphonopyruvate decarboxylase
MNMIDQNKFYDCLVEAGVDFVTGVPDSLLNDFCKFTSSELPIQKHVIAANEGNAIALAAGHHLITGGIPLVYMQNSGIGNSMNPLVSLVNKEVYSIPLILLIGWRGDPSVKDHAQHDLQGKMTTGLMDLMNIPYKIIDVADDPFEIARWAVLEAKKINSPVAIIAKNKVFSCGEKKTDLEISDVLPLSREEAISCVLKSLPKDTIYIATTGRATRELYDLRLINNENHKNDFLNVGAMGHGSSIGMGMAIAQKERFVVCLDGDAASIMHMGAMTTAGKIASKNFIHIILNNGAHESVGGQQSAGFMINFTEIAKNCGYTTIGKPVKSESELCDAVKELSKKDGPLFIDIYIRKGIRSDLGPLKGSLAEMKKDFCSNV